jgi:hypothetical protein
MSSADGKGEVLIRGLFRFIFAPFGKKEVVLESVTAERSSLGGQTTMRKVRREK